MVYVKSTIDNKSYLVRDLKDKQHAANMMARLNQNTQTLSQHLFNNMDSILQSLSKTDRDDFKHYIERLTTRSPDIIFVENTNDNEYTSYSVNKGEQIVFCIRTKDSNNKIYDLNLIMYVVLHELSHVACPIYDNHGPLFRKIFAFLTQQAIKINLYSKIEFEHQPVNYCGLTISDSII